MVALGLFPLADRCSAIVVINFPQLRNVANIFTLRNFTAAFEALLGESLRICIENAVCIYREPKEISKETGRVADWCTSCNEHVMCTTGLSVKELLERATALAESERLEIMDRATVLHGYVELAGLDPNNGTYRKSVEDAVTNLQELVYDCVTW